MISGRYPLWNEKLKMNVKAGYGLSRFISAEGDEPSVINFAQPSDFVSNFDHGLYSGLGVEYNLGHNRIFVEYSFYLGLTDVSFIGPSKNRSVHLGIGYATGF